MTTFDELAVEFSQRPVTLVDVETPFCSLRYGVGICSPDSRELFAIEGTSGWNPSTDALLADDITFVIAGIRSLQIDKPGATVAEASADRADLVDIGDLTGRKMRVAFNVTSSLIPLLGASGLFVRLGDNGTTDYKDFYLPPASLKVGMNLFVFEWDSPSATVGAPAATPIYLEIGAFSAAAGTTWVASLWVDDFIIISNNPQKFPCYNTRATCRDPGHFFTQKTIKTFRFSGEEAPIVSGATGPTILPAIRSKGIKLIPTKIDQERGYGRRDFIQVSFTDFLDDDRQTDPYLSIRNKKPESTFFRKFVARNPFLKGRTLILREGLGIDDPESGKVYVDLNEFRVRRYVIDRVDGPDKSGVVTIVAKDILKELDAQQIPAPSDAQLVSTTDISPADTLIELSEDSVKNLVDQFNEAGFVLPFGQFYVRIDDEIMLVPFDPSGGNFLTVVREQLGTSAVEHEADSKVQLVQSWVNVRVDDIWSDIQTQSGIDPSLVGLAGAQAETTTFLSEYILTAHISVPTKSSDLMKFLNQQCGCLTWWDTEDQLTSFKPIRPALPGEKSRTFSDASEIVHKTPSIIRREETRVTNAFVYFDVIDWSAKLDEPGNYRKAILFIDADAESEDQYDDRKSKTFFNFFFPKGFEAIARSVAARYVANFRNPKKAATLNVTTKDGAFIKPSDLVDLSTFGLVDFDGRVVSTKFLVISKRRLDPLGMQWEFGLEDAEFAGLRFAFWCDEDVPDYVVATEQQKQDCAFWAGDDCLLPDGSDPYLWV